MSPWLYHRSIQPARQRLGRRTDWRRNQRGAVLVEAALVCIPLCLIVFGIIEYGFIFKDSLTLSSATRSGARIASAEPTSPAAFYTDTIQAVESSSSVVGFSAGDPASSDVSLQPDELWIYKVDPAYTDGRPEGSNGNTWNCVADCRLYLYDGTPDPAPDTTSETSGTKWRPKYPDLGLHDPADGWWLADTRAACQNKADSVGVFLTLHHHPITGFFNFVLLKEYTVMRLEPQYNIGSGNVC